MLDDPPPGSEIELGNPGPIALGIQPFVHKILNTRRVDSAAEVINRQSIIHCRGFHEAFAFHQITISLQLSTPARLFRLPLSGASIQHPDSGRTSLRWMPLNSVRHRELALLETLYHGRTRLPGERNSSDEVIPEDARQREESVKNDETVDRK